MSDITNLYVQRELKPKIEDVLPYFIDGEELEMAIKFVAYLRANKINLRWAGVHNFWNAKNKGKNICFVKLGASWLGRKLPGTEVQVKWEVLPSLINMDKYETKIIDMNMQHYIWDGFAYCRSSCNNGCASPASKTILNKDFTGLCNGMFFGSRLPISFVNPDEAAIEAVKKLLEWEKQARVG